MPAYDEVQRPPTPKEVKDAELRAAYQRLIRESELRVRLNELQDRAAGSPSKDLLTAQQMIEQLERAADNKAFGKEKGK